MTTLQNMEETKTAPTLNETLEEWEATAPEMLAVEAIKTKPELQPRDITLIKNVPERLNQHVRLKENIANMTDLLKADNSRTLRPALVLKMGDDYFMVDGHHRLMAYQKAARLEMPARVLDTTLNRAVVIAGLANTRGSTVALHRNEVTEAVWQTLSRITRQGRRTWEQCEGYSYDSIRGLFNFQITKDTIGRMVKAIAWLRESSEPIDEWPTWKQCCKLRREGRMPEQKELDDAEAIQKLANRLAGLVKDKDPKLVKPAIRRMEEMMVEYECARYGEYCEWDDEDIY